MVERVTNRAATDKTVADSFAKLTRDDLLKRAGGGRHRLCRGQHHGRSRHPSASAPHRGRYAERQGEPTPRRRRSSSASSGITARCLRSASTSNFPKLLAPEIVMTESPSTGKLDLDHLRQLDRPHPGSLRHRHRATRQGFARDAVPGDRRAQDRRRRAVDHALVPGAAGVSDVAARARTAIRPAAASCRRCRCRAGCGPAANSNFSMPCASAMKPSAPRASAM